MPPSKVPNSVAKLVLELADQQKEPAEIAQILNLKKVQVSTLLAYHKQLETKTHETADPTADVELPEPVQEEPVEADIEVEIPLVAAVIGGMRCQRAAALFRVTPKTAAKWSLSTAQGKSGILVDVHSV